MNKILIVKCGVLASILLLSACSDNTSEPYTSFSEAQKQQLYQQSSVFFANDSAEQNLIDLAQILADVDKRSTLTPSSLQTPFTPQNCILGPKTNETRIIMDEASIHPAKKKRLARNFEQFLAFQFLALGVCVLSDGDRLQVSQSNSWQTYLQALVNIINTHEVLTKGEVSVYEADSQLGLFAFSLAHHTSRAFVAFNFSYDVQEIPLPFGFMASTKVTLWQSDAIQAHTFVSSSPLMMRPLTVSVVLVN